MALSEMGVDGILKGETLRCSRCERAPKVDGAGLMHVNPSKRITNIWVKNN